MHRFENEVLDDRAALGPQRAGMVLFLEGEVTGRVSYDEPAKTSVADQDIGTKSQHEIRYVELASDEHCVRELVGCASFEVEVSRSANSKCGVWAKWLIASQARRSPRQRLARLCGDAARNGVEPTAQLFAIVGAINGSA